MKIFITGVTGYIGFGLALKLAEEGHHIHVLVRNPDSSRIPFHPHIQVHIGDILDRNSVHKSMQGCEIVFHTAACIRIWAKDSEEIFKTNVEGTANVLAEAWDSGVKRFVFTSSCSVIGPGFLEPRTENDPRVTCFEIDYELSKKMAEDIALQYAKRGMDLVIVSPSKIHGPGKASHPLSTNTIIDNFLKRGIAFIPAPGNYQACFAFIDDVINGHLLAMRKGRSGEKYILGGINISYHEFFELIRKISSTRGQVIQLSKNTIRGWAILQNLKYMLTGKPPLFTIRSIGHLFSNYSFSSEKARKDLGYHITPIHEALQITIHYLNHQDND